MSTCFTQTLALTGLDRATANHDLAIQSLINYAAAHHVNEADVYGNAIRETLRRIEPDVHPITFRELQAKLLPIAERLDRN